MIDYNELYELLRKEKYSEGLQSLPKGFLIEFSDFLAHLKVDSSSGDDLLSETGDKSKKQFENSVSIFRELIRIRKKKILNLVFVAVETGIMKRDYENMLEFERETFDKLVKSFEEGDKALNKVINGKKEINKFKMIIFEGDVEQFVDMQGNTLGPFAKGELANLEGEIADILVSSAKASFVDES